MAATLNWTADALFAVLKAYFDTLLAPLPVVRGQGNRVPVPAPLGNDWAVITPLFQQMLSTPVVDMAADATQFQTVTVGMLWNLQFDFFGPNSQSNSAIAMLPWRTAWAADQLPGISPLYTGDAVQSPHFGGEDQFEEHWRVEAAIEYVAILTVAQASALALALGFVSVAAYPPSE